MKTIHFGGPVTIGDTQHAAYTTAEVDEATAEWLLSLGRHTAGEPASEAKPHPHGKAHPQRPPQHPPE